MKSKLFPILPTLLVKFMPQVGSDKFKVGLWFRTGKGHNKWVTQDIDCWVSFRSIDHKKTVDQRLGTCQPVKYDMLKQVHKILIINHALWE